MTTHSTAIYENGTLKLAEPLPLENGVTVEVVVTAPDAMPRANIAAAFAAIAAMPMEADDQGFCGADHDKVLYGANRENAGMLQALQDVKELTKNMTPKIDTKNFLREAREGAMYGLTHDD